MSCGNPLPVAQLINVRISTDAKLEFTKAPKLGGGKDYIFLVTPFVIALPEGFDVNIGKNSFRAVFNWKDAAADVFNMVPVDQAIAPIKCTLPAGTHFMSSGGLPLILAQNLEVELPPACPIVLLAQTKLQQTDVPVKLVLDNDCDAVLTRA